MVDLKNIPDYGNGPFPDVPEDVFAEIGCRLILLQNLELIITVVAKIAFETDPLKAKESILKSDTKTMGQLIGLLKGKVRIHDNFEATLKRTLKARNFFVHEFSNVYNLCSKDGLAKAINFLAETLDDLEEVTNTMKAVTIAYGRERGLSDLEHEENWRKYGDLDRLETCYIPKVVEIFEEKNA